MTASHDNFYVVNLIDRESGVQGRVQEMEAGAFTDRIGTNSAAPNLDNDGNPKILGLTLSTGQFILIPDETIALGTPILPFVFTIKDESGTAGAFDKVINVESGTLDGGSQTIINTNFGSVTLYVDGTNTHILSTN